MKIAGRQECSEETLHMHGTPNDLSDLNDHVSPT